MNKHKYSGRFVAEIVQFFRERVCYYSEELGQLIRFVEGDTLSMQFCMEFQRDGFSISTFRYWLRAGLIVAGVRSTIEFPFGRTETGRHLTEYWYPKSIEDICNCLDHHRPRKPYPLPFKDPKAPIGFVFGEAIVIRPSNSEAEWSSPGRPIAMLNTLLKLIGEPVLDTKEGNALLARLDLILESTKPQVYWMDRKPSEVYSTDSCTEYVSCMKQEPESYFVIYDMFHAEGSLRMIGIDREGVRVGRALVWFGSNPDDSYLDRVYAPGHRQVFDQSIVDAVKNFCAEHNINKTVAQQTAEWFGLEHIRRFSIEVPGGCGPDDFSEFPYVDNLCYFGYDGKLRNYEASGVRHITLRDTNGRYDEAEEDDEDYVDVGGNRVHISDAVWVSRYDEHYMAADCSYSAYLGAYVVDDDSVTTYDGCLIWMDDAVELHDGEYARDEDCGLVTLANLEHAISGRDNVVCLHDGVYVLGDDEDIVELHDGEYAFRTDCVEVDGIWYLIGDEPEPEQEDEDEADES